MALLKITTVAIFCFHVLQLSNAKAVGLSTLDKTGVLQLSNATKAAGPGALNRTGVLLNSSTEEHLRKTRTAGNCYVDLYQNSNYEGNRLRVFGEVYNLHNNGFNDKASSAKVYGPCQWIFYVHEFHGDPSVLTAGNYESTFRWGQYSDQLTSLRCMPPAGTRAIVFFEHIYFEGQSRVLYGSENHFGDIDFHDRASSAIVTGGCWMLYEHSNYQGHSRRVCTGHEISLHSLSDKVSSVQLL